jgi:hypothetical protein
MHKEGDSRMQLINRLFSVVLIILVVGMLHSCAATTLKNLWKDPD